MKPMKRGVCFALAASLCLAALPLAAQVRTGQGNSTKSGTKTKTSSSSGKSSSAQAPGVKGIFDFATTSGLGAKSGSIAPAAGRNSSTTSPFGTTSPPRTKTSSARRWKTTCKIADCIREKAIPSNTNITISGKIINSPSDGRYTIITMFDSVSITTESGATADVPVTFTVVMDAGIAENTTFKPDSRKSFTVDSNYVYLVWDDSGCTVRAVDNSLTEDPQPQAATKPARESTNRTNRNRSGSGSDITF